MEDGKYGKNEQHPLAGPLLLTRNPKVDGSYYFYAPNKAAPIFFAVAFAASGILHFWQS